VAILIVDEIYHGLGLRRPGLVSVLEVDPNVRSIAFPKYSDNDGWRIGWLGRAEARVLPGLEKLAQNLFISMSTMAQYAALAAFEAGHAKTSSTSGRGYFRTRAILMRALKASA